MSPERDPLTVFAQLAADLGPALIPVGHRELLHNITETARRLFTARACSLALLTESEDELEFIMASGEGADAVRELRIPASQGIAGWVVMSGQAIAVDDVGADPRFAASVAETTGYVPRSILAMPLQTDRRVLGVIEVLDRSERSPAGLGDMELLALFAGQAALVIEGSTMFGELGRVLVESLALAATDADVVMQLQRLSASAPQPRKDLGEIAALFQELGRVGPRERRLAVRVLRDVLDYARDREPE